MCAGHEKPENPFSVTEVYVEILSVFVGTV